MWDSPVGDINMLETTTMTGDCFNKPSNGDDLGVVYEIGFTILSAPQMSSKKLHVSGLVLGICGQLCTVGDEI
jgi:hypothetical protein